MIARFLCCFAFILYGLNGLEIINQTLVNQNIICPINDDCIVSCNTLNGNGTACNGLSLTCNNNINGICKLTCIGRDSCKNVKLNALNVNKIEILCTDNACGHTEFYIRLADSLSTSKFECIGRYACLEARIIIDTPSLDKNEDNNILSNTNISRIYINCNGESSCEDTIVSIIGVNNFDLDCFGEKSCGEISLSMTSLNENPSGSVNMNCNGKLSCEFAIINGIALQNVNLNCNNEQDSCKETQIYCPLYGLGLLTNDTNNDTYYSFDNINPNTCNINYNNQGIGSQIYTIYGTTATNILNGNPAIYCDFDFDVNIFGYLPPQLYSTPIECTNREYIETNIHTIDNLTNYLILSDPHSNITECIDENDCIMYINSALYPKQISCNDAYICTVICMDPFSCSNGIIDGSQSKSLDIRRTKFNHFHAPGLTVYGPKGIGTDLTITDGTGHKGFENSIIHANNTDIIKLEKQTSGGRNSFLNMVLYAYEASNITVNCENGWFNCENMSIHISDDSFSILNPSIPDKLTIICNKNYDDECHQLKVFISYNNSNNIWGCMYIYNETNWHCVGMSNSLSPTLSPTTSPTLETLIPAVTPTIKSISSNQPNNSKTLYVIILTNSIVLGVAISLCCLIMVFVRIYRKQKGRKMSENMIKNSYTSSKNEINPEIPNGYASNSASIKDEIDPKKLNASSLHIPNNAPQIISVKSNSTTYNENNNDDSKNDELNIPIEGVIEEPTTPGNTSGADIGDV